ncbi:ornithine cyclodeaminase family protein [Bosea sp. (in: a-proteobacteria)]|uniref:ornithine cyclodeaminase family protein n=1 Tax=Bosea sp. (in: a-proteobacteria) TaxID=1871050 RepID=UPI00262C7BF1|nr:ornithine cyclodeaminase family protein [Bosea sp. (in: a-proteobacteria)]MCO5092146.1 ornithine cyclodeaminase family protein [Bosea sp. (in: a-proteobacteria)]
MKLLSEADVYALANPDEAIRASRVAFEALSSGQADMPIRAEIHRPDVGGVILVMPGLIRDRVFGLKIIANRRREGAEGLATTSMILLFEADSLAPLGLVSSDYFTDFRTAAGLAAATDELARPDARVLAVYGSGKLSEPSVRLIARVRSLERVILVGRTPSRVAALAERLRRDPLPGNPRIDIDIGPDDAAEKADIVTAVTSAVAPVFDGRRIRPGTHINAGGAFQPTTREVDDHVAGRACCYVDSMASCLERAGDIRIPLDSGVLDRRRLRGEIGACLAGRIPGRQSRDEITMFKSLGTAVQDLILCEDLLHKVGSAHGMTFDHLGDSACMA